MKTRDCEACGCPTRTYSEELFTLTGEVLCSTCNFNEIEEN